MLKRARTAGAIAAVAVGLAAVGGSLGALAGGGEPEGPKPASVEQVVDAISEKWPLPNPRDTSSGCKAKEGDTGKGCESRVTTDAVTVAEYADEQTARTAAATLAKAGDARPAGRYVLSWVGDQDVTSDEARADMIAIAKSL